MKIATVNKYNKNNIQLTFKEVPMPQPKKNQILIKSLTAGVNPVDNMISRGQLKLILPYKLPLISGNEVVGKVIKTGSDVNEFQQGDRIFARLPLNHIGAFAEYIAIDSNAVAKVPDYLSDEEAAAIPLTGLTAMQAFDLMNIQKGKRIFISGGTGSFGAIAIPLAKYFGLYVITNGNGNNSKQVLNLGADEFIDYKKENYLNVISNKVDYIIDTLGGEETKKQFKILKSNGKLVSLKNMPNYEFAKQMHLPLSKRILFGLAGAKLDRLATKNNQKYYFLFVKENGQQLKKIATIYKEKQMHPQIDQVFPFEQINDALSKIDQGHSKGKTIIKF